MGPSLLSVRFLGPPGEVLHSRPGRGGGLGAPGSAGQAGALRGSGLSPGEALQRRVWNLGSAALEAGWRGVAGPRGPLCREQERR